MSGSTGRIALGVVGAVVGAYFGQPALGYAIGSGIGAIAFPDQLPDITQEGPKLGDLRVMSSAYGRALPIAFGVVRVAGNLIWSSGIDQHTITRTEEVNNGDGGGKGGPPSQEVTTTTYTYSANFAISLCEGTIFGIRRIWANGELVVDLGTNASYATYVTSGTFASISLASLSGPGTEQTGPASMRVYAGDETQEQDPLILAHEGDTPAYRGVAYVVFENLQLARFNNGLPNLEFEVITVGTSAESLLQLDSVSQFGLAANGSITPDGLLLVAYQQTSSPYTSTLSLVDPFDVSPIRDYNANAYMTGGAHVAPSLPPRMNGRGDIVYADENFGLWFWPSGGSPTQFAVDAGTRSWVDGNGNFYVGGRRLIDSHYDVMKIAPQTGAITIFRDLGTTANGQLKDLFDSRDGFLWYAYRATTGMIEKLDGLSNAVVDAWVTNAIPHSLAVAGDGSVWYLSGASTTVKLWRVNPALTSEALIFDSGGTHTGASAVRLGRDWSNGDILYADGAVGTLKRYDESGTLDSTITVATPTLGVASDAAFPDRIYTFANLGGGTQFIHGYRALSIAESTVTVAQAIAALCDRVGLLSGDIDVSALSMQLRGYVIAARGPARNALYQLMTAFMFDAVESSSRIKFVLRGAASVATLLEDDLGARLGAMDEGGEAYSIARQQEPELPHELAINYLDAAASYQVGTQYGRRLIGHSDNDQSISLAVVMTADEAVQLAHALLYEAWAARQQYKVAVSSKWSSLEPTDAVTLLLDDGSQLLGRVLRTTEGQGVRELEVVGYEPSNYVQDAGGAALPVPPSTGVGISQTLLEMLDTALLRDMDDTYGLLVAACGYTDNWPGCKVFKSADAVTYVDAAISVPLPVPMGYTLTQLGNFTTGYFDETNTVEVSVLSGTLASTSESAVLNGANGCYLGGEILQFKNAVLIDDGKYRLSGLLRGRLGTEWAISRHVIGQVFVKLDAALLRSLETPVSDQGTLRYYKGVTFGTPVSQASAKSVTQASNRLKPISPAYVGGGRDASANIVINWMRRARKSTAWIDAMDVPLDEPSELYELDLFAGSGTAITGITASNNGVVASSAHGLIVGDVVHIAGVVGMTPVNDRVYIVDTVPDTGHFTVGEPTAGYAAYVSGGVVRKRGRTITGVGAAKTASYTAANQTTDYGGTQATVYVAVYQISSRVGRGYAGIGTI